MMTANKFFCNINNKGDYEKACIEVIFLGKCTIPFACRKTRVMFRVLVSHTLIIPSSDPETNKNPSELEAKQVTDLLFHISRMSTQDN